MELIEKLDRRKTKSGNGMQSWGIFLCPLCGNKVEKHLGNGRRDSSCGCGHYKGKNLKHGKSGSLLYKVWLSMNSRCRCESDSGYSYYGARGIQVCPEWKHDYSAFEIWALSNGYKLGLQIDRKDNNGWYGPDNCRFVTRQIQMRNTRRSKLNSESVSRMKALYRESTKTKVEISKIFGISQQYTGAILNGKYWN